MDRDGFDRRHAHVRHGGRIHRLAVQSALYGSQMRLADGRGRVYRRAIMAGAWRNWYHAMGNTYATWPPGDPRGWRSWRHREHCEGDYKHPPPPGKHDDLLRRSLKLMKRAPVLLTPRQRVIAARAMGSV